jgi:hypothetical protein
MKFALSRFYLAYETMRNFAGLTGGESLPDILAQICDAREFAEVVLRMGEKKLLNALNQPKGGAAAAARFKLEGKVKTPAMKVNLLIQVGTVQHPLKQPFTYFIDTQMDLITVRCHVIIMFTGDAGRHTNS